MRRSRGILHRLMALGLLIIFSVLAWFAAVEPVISLYAQKRDDVLEARRLLAEAEGVLAKALDRAGVGQ